MAISYSSISSPLGVFLVQLSHDLKSSAVLFLFLKIVAHCRVVDDLSKFSGHWNVTIENDLTMFLPRLGQ